MEEVEECNLYKDLVSYLDITGQLVSLSRSIQTFSTNSSEISDNSGLNDTISSFNSISAGNTKPFRQIFYFDVVEVCNVSPGLAVLVETARGRFVELLQDVVYKFTQYSGSEDIISKSQVCVTPVISGLSSSSRVQSLGDILRFSSSQELMTMQGKLVGRSAKIHYVSRTTYLCSSPVCCGNTEDGIYVKMRNMAESGREKINQECFLCGNILIEQYSSRDISSKVCGLLIPETRSNELKIKQTFTIILSRTDAALAILGQNYEIVFKPVFERRGKEVGILLEVSSLVHLQDPDCRTIRSGSVSVPETLYRIYKDRSASPWSFLLTLAYLTGNESTPRGFLIKFKLCLLLSLVSTGSRNKIHVLALGTDTNIISRLMKECLELVPGVQIFNPISLGSESKQFPGFKTGSDLQVATDTVCWVGDVNRLKPKAWNEVKHKLESSSSLNIRETPKIPGAVWSYAYSDTRKQGKRNLILESLHSYGIIYQVDDELSSDEIVSSHLLSGAMGSGQRRVISNKDLGDFIRQARYLEPRMKEESLHLLNQYFKASRAARDSSLDSIGFPRCALQTLLVVAESISKLNLEPEISYNHSVMSCYIYEEIISSLSGYSFLGVNPSQHSETGSLESVLGKQNDLRMKEFETQLKMFFQTYLENTWEE